MPPYKPKPPTSQTTRPPRLRQINEQFVGGLTSTAIWSAFAKDFAEHASDRQRWYISEVCALAHVEAEIAFISQQFEPDGASFKARAKKVAILSEKLLAELMPEKDELVPKGSPTIGIDGLDHGKRHEIIASIGSHTSDLHLGQQCAPDLKDAFERQDGTANGHPIFGASDPANVSELIKQLALVHRRSSAAANASGPNFWGKKQPSRIFMEAVTWRVLGLRLALGVAGQTRYSTKRGKVAGWLPEFLRAAEAHAIKHGVKGLVSRVSKDTIANVCKGARRQR